MIETVINLQGEREKFDAKKLNHWVQGVVSGINEEEWSALALETVRDMPNEVTVQQLMKKLIDSLLARSSWSHYLMAGRLMAVLNRIEIFGSKKIPTVREVQDRLFKADLMRKLKYNDYEWSVIEAEVNHDLDMTYPHFALEQLRFKYSLQDFSAKVEFETPQFVYMRMAMAIFEPNEETKFGENLNVEDPTKRTRLEHVLRTYRHLANKRLSAPTPNYNNLGTYHQGYASCCLIAVGDSRWSLAAGDHITYIMTTQSAGIGLNLMTRSLGDPVQKGRFLHRGKLPYIATFGKNIRANLQGGRGGAGTLYYNLFDPEAEVISGLRDQRATDTARNRDAHYAYVTNDFMVMKMAKNEEVMTWNCKTAPELNEAFYGPDIHKFAEQYYKLQDDSSFKKNYVSARNTVVKAIIQGIQTGTVYAASIDEMNRNTPFLDPILSSNLCLEVSEPTWPYDGRDALKELYSTKEVGYAKFYATDENGEKEYFHLKASDTVDKLGGSRYVAQNLKQGMQFVHYDEHGNGGVYTVTEIKEIKKEPEVALCSLASVNATEEMPNEVYADVCYYALKMIDYCIYENDYVLPHIGVTAKARMNAGVGIMGVATHMARRRLKYNEEAGLRELHKLFERHLWYVTEASLLISKERGLAPWIKRTKWPDGWTPLSTYRREIDSIVPGGFTYEFDWNDMSRRIQDNGGLAHSCLVNFMPGESSSKALGVVNSIYGIRQLVLNKTDSGIVLRWAAPYGDDPAYMYQSMWELTIEDQNSLYGLAQKFSDQAVSADWFISFMNRLTVMTTEIIGWEIDRVTKGVKTRYYINTLVPNTKGKSMEISKSVHDMLKEIANAERPVPEEGVAISVGDLNPTGAQELSPELLAALAASGISFGDADAVEGGDGHIACDGCSA